MSNYISAEITAAKVTETLGYLTSVKNNMPFLIKLDPSVKKTMAPLDDQRAPFVNKCLQYAQREAKIVAPYVDLIELNKDITLFTNLQAISREINRLADMINDTRIAAGCDAYVTALSIYNSAKQAAKMNVPGTKAIVDDLKTAFEGQGSTAKEAAAKN
jgi:hypothetical protein